MRPYFYLFFFVLLAPLQAEPQSGSFCFGVNTEAAYLLVIENKVELFNSLNLARNQADGFFHSWFQLLRNEGDGAALIAKAHDLSGVAPENVNHARELLLSYLSFIDNMSPASAARTLEFMLHYWRERHLAEQEVSEFFRSRVAMLVRQTQLNSDYSGHSEFNSAEALLDEYQSRIPGWRELHTVASGKRSFQTAVRQVGSELDTTVTFGHVLRDERPGIEFAEISRFEKTHIHQDVFPYQEYTEYRLPLDQPSMPVFYDKDRTMREFDLEREFEASSTIDRDPVGFYLRPGSVIQIQQIWDRNVAHIEMHESDSTFRENDVLAGPDGTQHLVFVSIKFNPADVIYTPDPNAPAEMRYNPEDIKRKQWFSGFMGKQFQGFVPVSVLRANPLESLNPSAEGSQGSVPDGGAMRELLEAMDEATRPENEDPF